jgi:hypothetical protein
MLYIESSYIKNRQGRFYFVTLFTHCIYNTYTDTAVHVCIYMYIICIYICGIYILLITYTYLWYMWWYIHMYIPYICPEATGSSNQDRSYLVFCFWQKREHSTQKSYDRVRKFLLFWIIGDYLLDIKFQEWSGIRNHNGKIKALQFLVIFIWKCRIQVFKNVLWDVLR